MLDEGLYILRHRVKNGQTGGAEDALLVIRPFLAEDPRLQIDALAMVLWAERTRRQVKQQILSQLPCQGFQVAGRRLDCNDGLEELTHLLQNALHCLDREGPMHSRAVSLSEGSVGIDLFVPLDR